jgi:hypothetical protein
MEEEEELAHSDRSLEWGAFFEFRAELENKGASNNRGGEHGGGGGSSTKKKKKPLSLSSAKKDRLSVSGDLSPIHSVKSAVASSSGRGN